MTYCTLAPGYCNGCGHCTDNILCDCGCWFVPCEDHIECPSCGQEYENVNGFIEPVEEE